MIVPADDYFHERTDDPHWNESGWFGFNVPGRSLSGFVYVNHRPNMHLSLAGFALWDPSGRHPHDCLWHDWEMHHLPDGAEMFDFSLDTGLGVECVEPQRTYRLTYKNGPCEAELTWHRFMEPHDSGVPDGWAGWGQTGHYEQGGRMTGTARIEGETIEINCLSMRDHSWGPRRPVSTARGDFPWAIASENSGFLIHALSDLPRDRDPVHGTTESIQAGWYLRDGILSPLASGEHRIVERGDDGRPLTVEIEAEDELGRSLQAEGRCANGLLFSFPYNYWWWALTEWRFDGGQGWGELQDAFNTPQLRRFMRSLKRP